MKLKEISVTNFRGIRSLNLSLDGLTILIGENNSGKSTILDAIRFALTRGFGARREGRFTEYDFHLKNSAATPQAAAPISVILHFAEEQEDEWPETLVQQLGDAVQVGADGLYHIWLQAKGNYQSESGSFGTHRVFLNTDGAELVLKNPASLNLFSKFVPLFFLSAIRNAAQEFGQSGQFWSGFLKSIELPGDEREKIEEMLRTINTAVIGANSGLNAVTKKIADAGRLVPLDSANPVVLEAIPTRVFDMVGRIQVHLKSRYGAKLPLYRHGEGTQSLAVLMLFQAFVDANLSETYALESTPLLALEEPEAHLHPSAIRSLGSFLQQMTGQIVVTSHSGDLVSRVPVMSLRRLYKNNGETKIGQVDSRKFTSRELQAIDYSICLSRGHYLFSRCWLLVEGESDYHLMPLLFSIMGYSQDKISFSVIEISQVIDKGEPLIKFAIELGIEWFLMADGDPAGNDYVSRASNHLGAEESLTDRARTLTLPDIEHEFWHNGYQDFIKGMVPPKHQRRITLAAAGETAKETKLLIEAAIKRTGGKPAFTQALATEIRLRGAGTIPPMIKDIITRVVQLAGD